MTPEMTGLLINIANFIFGDIDGVPGLDAQAHGVAPGEMSIDFP